jgi:hypothetical protein
MDAFLDTISRSVEQLLGRASGPLHFRLFIMPIVVTILAIRAHLKDVREGNLIFLGAFLKDRTERWRLLRSGLRDFGKVFIVACVLDTTYQILVLKAFYPLQMLIVAVVCAIVPYFLIRGPVTRLVHALRRHRRGTPEATTSETIPDFESDGDEERAHE